MYLGDKQEDLTEFKAISMLHEVNNHKDEMQLINAYSKAGRMSPKVSADTKRVIME